MPYREDIREDNFKSRIKDLERQLAEAMDYIKAIADDIQEDHSARWAEVIREWKPKNSWGRNAKRREQEARREPKKSKSVECGQCSVHFTPEHKHQDLCSDRCAEIYNSRYRRGE